MEKIQKRHSLSRRDFVKILGGGVYIFFNSWDLPGLLASPLQQRRSLPQDFNAFLHIAEDGKVSCYTGKVELGQGITTSLAQIMSDELDVPMESVTVVVGDTDLCPWDGGTNGSRTIRSFSVAMRAAAAEARGVMLELGSEYLKVPVAQLQIADGVIISKISSDKKVSYAQLTKGKKIEKHLVSKPSGKDYKEFKNIGKSFLNRDGLSKVTGKGQFSGDIRIEGLMHARVLHPPSHGAKLISADTSEAKKIKGVIVVEQDGLIAVLHQNRDNADEALMKIKAEYTFDELKVNENSIFDHLLKVSSDGSVVNEKGSIAARKNEGFLTESVYYNSYVAHAPMEPHTATAHMEGDKMTVWIGTQQPFPAQENLSRQLNMPLEKIRVIAPFTGGGFGGKSSHQQAVEAAKLAKITGKPVVVAWTRQEEFFYDPFRPAAIVKLNSGCDKTGKITFWDFNVYYAGTRGSDTIYDVADARTMSFGGRSGAKSHPFATGAWRAPGNNTNTFARESQIDIMASKAGIDPLEFRLKNLKDQRMTDVLRAAADLFGYTPAKTPSGRGIGIACGTDVETYVAHIAEVKVNNDGSVRVLRVACAQDMGLCINPEGAVLQMEGCIIMGLGYAFEEEIKFEGGSIGSRNFDTYHIPRFSWLPEIKTKILDRPDQPAHGGGEPGVICMGAVLANAVHDATGARLFHLPMTPERILESMKKSNQ